MKGPLCEHAAAGRGRSGAVTAAAGRMRRRLSSGDGPRSQTTGATHVPRCRTALRLEPRLTLKVIIILIATDSGYQVMTSDDYDGDVEKIVREYDPWGV